VKPKYLSRDNAVQVFAFDRTSSLFVLISSISPSTHLYFSIHSSLLPSPFVCLFAVVGIQNPFQDSHTPTSPSFLALIAIMSTPSIEVFPTFPWHLVWTAVALVYCVLYYLDHSSSQVCQQLSGHQELGREAPQCCSANPLLCMEIFFRQMG